MINDSYDVSKSFQRIEDKLIQSLHRNLTRHFNEEGDLDIRWSAWQTEQLKSLRRFKKDNKKYFKSEFSTINKDIRDFLKNSYEDARLNQENNILRAIIEERFYSQDKNIQKLYNQYRFSKSDRVKKKNYKRMIKEANKREASFFKINEKKLNQLISETTTNMKRAENSILRYTEDQFRKIIFDAQVYANTGAGTEQQAVDMATKDFLSKGINNIEYSNGARVNIKSYAEMAIRTANLRANLYADGEMREKWGVHTVLVPNRNGGCPYCIKFQGLIFIDDVYSNGTEEESKKTGYPLLSWAIKNGLFHPNCKDTVTTYFPGINSEVTPPTREEKIHKIENYKKEQKINYIDRQIDKFKRLEAGSVDPENIEKYHQKRLDWQEYKRKFIANSNLSFNDVTNTGKNGIIDSDKKNIRTIINKNTNKSKKVFSKYENEINVIETDFKGTPHYSPTKNGIVFNLSEDRNKKYVDNEVVKPEYYTYFHESGHHISNIFSKRTNNSKDVSEWFESKKYFRKVTDKTGNKVDVGYTLNDMLKKEGWDYFDNRILEIKQDYKDKGIKDRVTISTVYNDLKDKFSEMTYLEQTDISDMFDGITNGKVYGCSAHSKSNPKYWRTHEPGVEAFAEMFSATINNPNSLKRIKEFFPKSYEIFEEIMEEMLK